MQKTFTLDEAHLSRFLALCQRKGWTEEQALSEALDILISHYATDEEIADRAFGLWKGNNIDALEFQRQLRAEWDDESL